MKSFTKILKALFLLLIISNVAKAQVYEEGKVVIDIYYGFPNIITTYLKSAIDSASRSNSSNQAIYSNITVSSIGPVGGRVEYLLTNRIGFGIDFSYSNTIAKYMDPNNPYNYQASVPRWRVVPRINIHLGNSKKFDPYFAFGIGYHSPYKVIYATNDPNYTGPAVSYIPLFTNSVVIMSKFGMRYFITDEFGLGVEVGFGGPLTTGGITVKF